MTDSKRLKIRKLQAAVLIVNIFIIITEILGLIISVKYYYISLVQFYTEDSNVFALIACVVLAVFTARNLIKGTTELPQWVKYFKYMAACCVTVTFIVVICILAPMEGAGGYSMMLFYGPMLYHHFICPVAVLVSFILLEEGPSNSRKTAFLAVIPTIIYGVIVLILNIAKVMEGPYPFLRVYEQPVYMSVIWMLVIFGGAYLLARLILFANSKFSIAVRDSETDKVLN